MITLQTLDDQKNLRSIVYNLYLILADEEGDDIEVLRFESLMTSQLKNSNTYEASEGLLRDHGGHSAAAVR